MAHNLSFNSQTGEWEVFTRGASWHSLGQITKDCQTWEDAMRLAGLNWTVSKRQLQYNGIEVPAWGLFRDDKFEPEEAFLCSTSQTFEAIQNHYMFSFLDVMVESDGKAAYEAAGSIGGGIQVFALVNLGAAFEIGSRGDRYENYLCFVEDRSGKRAAKCFITSVRVVCANTLERAYSGANDTQSVKFNHRQNIHSKMFAAADLFSGARMNLDLLRGKLGYLAQQDLTGQRVQLIMDTLFPVEEGEETMRRANVITDILNLFEKNDDNMFPEIRGTAYNLLNAVTEYVDHYQPVRRTNGKLLLTEGEIRGARAMFGEGAEFKNRAFETISRFTGIGTTTI